VAPPDQPEGAYEAEIADADVTQWEDRDDPDHLPTAALPAMSVGLAAEQQLDHQEERRQRFILSPEITVVSSANDKLSPTRPRRIQTACHFQIQTTNE
jgi:hypothetical protein